MNITVFSTPTCPFCIQVKEFFTENNIKFTDKDVSGDIEAQELMVQKTGQMGVPVIFFESNGQEQIVVGFNKQRIREILGM